MDRQTDITRLIKISNTGLRKVGKERVEIIENQRETKRQAEIDLQLTNFFCKVVQSEDSFLYCVLNIYCVLNCNTFKLLIIDHIWAYKYWIFSIVPTYVGIMHYNFMYWIYIIFSFSFKKFGLKSNQNKLSALFDRPPIW